MTDLNKICWICGNQADSAEHVLKRSDVSKFYQPTPKQNRDKVFFLKEQILLQLQSAKSKHIKYPNVLCAKCNNETTQPFDIAYSEFINWYDNHKNDVERWRTIDFYDIWGAHWGLKQSLLFKYFAKAFGCRLSHENILVPEDVRQIISQDTWRSGLCVTFTWNYDLILVNSGHKIMISYPLKPVHLPNGDVGYIAGHTYDCLVITYYYFTHSPFFDEHLGAPWSGNGRSVYLGWHSEKDEKKKMALIDSVLTSPSSKIIVPNL